MKKNHMNIFISLNIELYIYYDNVQMYLQLKKKKLFKLQKPTELATV